MTYYLMTGRGWLIMTQPKNFSCRWLRRHTHNAKNAHEALRRDMTLELITETALSWAKRLFIIQTHELHSIYAQVHLKSSNKTLLMCNYNRDTDNLKNLLPDAIIVMIHPISQRSSNRRPLYIDSTRKSRIDVYTTWIRVPLLSGKHIPSHMIIIIQCNKITKWGLMNVGLSYWYSVSPWRRYMISVIYWLIW